MAQIPPWVPALDSCISQSPKPHTFTFCTISHENMPKARTCVFRSWLFSDASTGVLVFTTDKRSNKISDLAHQDGKYEACFYFPNFSMQFRLSGFTQILSHHQYPSMTDISSTTIPCMPPPSPTAPPGFYPGGTHLTPYPPNMQHNRHHHHQQQQHSQHLQNPHNNFNQFVPRPSIPPPSKKYPVYSPGYKKTHDIYLEYTRPPSPTPEEWRAEYCRIWAEMRQSTKAAFRQPTPGTVMTDQNAYLIDAISRGVDGISDDAGMSNFTVLVMFVNHADCLTDRYMNRRLLYHRVNEGEWVEEQVCP